MKKFIAILALLVQLCHAQPSVMTRQEITRDLFGSAQIALPGNPPLLQSGPGPEAGNGGRKSIGLAVLYSFLLPGMGELYVGEYGSGKYFTAAEGVLWLTLGAIDRYANWLQDDARLFAAQHAQTSVDGKSEQYFADISNFHDVYAFNEQVLRDRDAFKVYNTSSSDYWQWDNEQNRSTYRDRRVSSNQMFNNTRFAAAAVAINHVVSAINAGRLAISHNKSLNDVGALEIHAGVLNGPDGPDGILLSVSRSF